MQEINNQVAGSRVYYREYVIFPFLDDGLNGPRMSLLNSVPTRYVWVVGDAEPVTARLRRSWSR